QRQRSFREVGRIELINEAADRATVAVARANPQTVLAGRHLQAAHHADRALRNDLVRLRTKLQREHVSRTVLDLARRVRRKERDFDVVVKQPVFFLVELQVRTVDLQRERDRVVRRRTAERHRGGRQRQAADGNGTPERIAQLRGGPLATDWL